MPARPGAGAAPSAAVDLYENAARFPTELRGRSEPVSYRALREQGFSESQIGWAVSRQRLLRPHHGFYAEVQDRDDLLNRARAALRAAPALALLGFQTAARLHGFGLLASPDVHLVTPAGTPFPQRAGIVAHQAVLPVDARVHVLGLPCVPPARCALDLARTLPRLDALPVLDAALFSGACRDTDLLRESHRHRRLRGVRQARELVPLADPRAECRQETQLRLLLHDNGLRGFVPQFPVVDGAGYPRYRIDLGDPDHLIGVEYDGSSHLDPSRLWRDRARHNWLAARGWAMRYFTAADLYQRPAHIVETVLTLRRSRANRRD